MQVSVQSGEGLERRMTVELPADEINQEVEKRLKQLARTAKMDGFRPGKVPVRVLRNRFGLQIQQEVFGDLVQSSFPQAVEQEKLRPAGAPSIEPDIEQGQDESKFAYTAVFEVLPEVSVAALDSYGIKRQVAEVADSDVDEMIERLRKQRRNWKEVDRASEEGDQLEISFEGKLDGETFEGGSGKNTQLELGSGMMIEGFESGLTGASAGDTRSLTLTFPEDYRAENLAGKEVTFDVEVHKVQEAELPEVDEEFAKAFGVESGDTEQFLKEIRANMERELKQRLQAGIKDQAMDVLIKAHDLTVPKALVEEEIDALLQQMRQNAYGGQMELPREMFKDQAERRVALGLIIAEIVKTNDIKVDQERVDSMIQDMAATYESPQEVIDFYKGNAQQRASVENLVLEEQVVDWIIEQADVSDEETTFKAVTEPAPQA